MGRFKRTFSAGVIGGALILGGCETDEAFWENMALATDTLAYELATTCTYQTDYRGVLYQQCPNGCQIYPSPYGGTYDVCPGDHYVPPAGYGYGQGRDGRWRDRDRDHDHGRDRDRDRHRDRDRDRDDD